MSPHDVLDLRQPGAVPALPTRTANELCLRLKLRRCASLNNAVGYGDRDQHVSNFFLSFRSLQAGRAHSWRTDDNRLSKLLRRKSLLVGTEITPEPNFIRAAFSKRCNIKSSITIEVRQHDRDGIRPILLEGMHRPGALGIAGILEPGDLLIPGLTGQHLNAVGTLSVAAPHFRPS